MSHDCAPIFTIVFQGNSFNDAGALVAGEPTFKDNSRNKGTGGPSEIFLCPTSKSISDIDPPDVICLEYQSYYYYDNLYVQRDNGNEYLSSYDPPPIVTVGDTTIHVPSLLTEVVCEYGQSGYSDDLTLAKISIKSSCASTSSSSSGNDPNEYSYAVYRENADDCTLEVSDIFQVVSVDGHIELALTADIIWRDSPYLQKQYNNEICSYDISGTYKVLIVATNTETNISIQKCVTVVLDPFCCVFAGRVYTYCNTCYDENCEDSI